MKEIEEAKVYSKENSYIKVFDLANINSTNLVIVCDTNIYYFDATHTFHVNYQGALVVYRYGELVSAYRKGKWEIVHYLSREYGENINTAVH